MVIVFVFGLDCSRVLDDKRKGLPAPIAHGEMRQEDEARASSERSTAAVVAKLTSSVSSPSAESLALSAWESPCRVSVDTSEPTYQLHEGTRTDQKQEGGALE